MFEFIIRNRRNCQDDRAAEFIVILTVFEKPCHDATVNKFVILAKLNCISDRSNKRCAANLNFAIEKGYAYGPLVISLLNYKLVLHDFGDLRIT